jgi:hypothetical protein
VGLVTIPELCTLILEKPYQHYFPIVNTFGNRIGDLHVGFSFSFIHQLQNAHCFSSMKSVQEKSRHRSMTSEEHSVNGQRRRLKQCHEHYKILPNYTSKYICDIYKSQRTRESQTVPDSLITDILKQGQKLRDAMVRSILEDDRTIADEGIDALLSDSSTDKTFGTQNGSRKVFFDGAKVMEFLYGKNMCYKLSFNNVFCFKIENQVSNQRTHKHYYIQKLIHCIFFPYGCVQTLTEKTDQTVKCCNDSSVREQ